MKAYNDKGRVNPVLENVPVFAVLTEDLGVRGAHKSAQLVRLGTK
jgi:glucokinase